MLLFLFNLTYLFVQVPPPNLANLPIRYQYLYPSFFQRTTSGTRRKTPYVILFVSVIIEIISLFFSVVALVQDLVKDLVKNLVKGLTSLLDQLQSSLRTV